MSARRTGFTLVEVMIAMALFAVGMVGVSYMQSASVRSNQDAYESMVATNFARTWMERIKRDAVGWTSAGDPQTNLMFATRPEAALANYFVPGAWLAPPAAPQIAPQAPRPLDLLESHGANYRGVEVGSFDPIEQRTVTNADIYYCAFSWFTTVHVRSGLTNAMRADVGVWWTRRGALDSIKSSSRLTTDYRAGIAGARADAQGCGGAGVIPDLSNYNNRVVYLTTVLHWTPHP